MDHGDDDNKDHGGSGGFYMGVVGGGVGTEGVDGGGSDGCNRGTSRGGRASAG